MNVVFCLWSLVTNKRAEGMSITYRVLQPGDEAALAAFVLPRISSSMFLLGNMRHVWAGG